MFASRVSVCDRERIEGKGVAEVLGEMKKTKTKERIGLYIIYK